MSHFKFYSALYQDLGRLGMAKDKLAHKGVQR